MRPALATEELRAGDVVRRIGSALERRGYSLSRFDAENGVLATMRGYGLWRVLPWTDFIFVVDLDAEQVADVEALDALHERHRFFGESQMRVPRPLRYRVPNSVTVGVSASGLSAPMIEYAGRSRHVANSGEKNAVFLYDLTSGRLHSQGLEIDTFGRHGGTWSPSVNPANRFYRTFAEVMAEVTGAPPATSREGVAQ